MFSSFKYFFPPSDCLDIFVCWKFRKNDNVSEFQFDMYPYTLDANILVKILKSFSGDFCNFILLGKADTFKQAFLFNILTKKYQNF